MKTAALILAALLLGACYSKIKSEDGAEDDGTDVTVEDATDGTDGDEIPVPCGEGEDPDDDTISSADEGSADTDGDTVPNDEDPDSDGDGIPDRIEAGDENCATAPVDSDGDGLADFVDTDSDNNGLRDEAEGNIDTDGDGTADFRDTDNDGDGIDDITEIGPDPSSPRDTDLDGVPDHRDLDSDGDRIADRTEGMGDQDGDGIPSYVDDDSDGDGWPDLDEARGCNPAGDVNDTDEDGMPDFLDLDSDGDGLPDAVELEIGSSRCLPDTDGDGYSDLVEWAHPEADPTDPEVGIPPDDYYLVLDPWGDVEERDLFFTTDIKHADVFFLIDTTGSMFQEIDRIKATLSSVIVPGIQGRVPDAWFGAGWFADFPTASYGDPSLDKPFVLVHSMTDDVGALQSAVNSIANAMGQDWPESHVEALYQTATGEGLGSWVLPYPCDTGVGAACFRPGAMPIILLITDAPMHNGPPGTVGDDYAGITPAPHTWDEAIAALNAVHARVVGLSSEDPSAPPGAWHDLTATAEATGTLDPAGNPLVLDIGTGGEFLDTRVIDAVEMLAEDIVIDVDTTTADMPDLYTEAGWTEVDATCFIRARIPQPGWVPPEGIAPEDAVASYDGTAFYGVVPGTRVTFRIQFQNYGCFEGDYAPRVFLARIVVRGDGATDLDERIVVVVVPPGNLDE
jgi:hypothetical protein